MSFSIKYCVTKFINLLIPKKKNSIFAEPHKNGKIECHDIINYFGDSVLTFLHFMLEEGYCKHNYIYLSVYDNERDKIIYDYISNYKDINITLVRHFSCFTGLKRYFCKVLYEIRKMRSEIWLSATVHTNKRFACKKQKLVCLEYFTSFKSDYNALPFDYLPKNWSLVCSTSVLDSVTKSAAFAIPFHCFKPLGLCRNDVLFKRTEKEPLIRDWIRKKTDRNYEKIIIYAPTYRDYEENVVKQRNVWGYDDETVIDKAIDKSNAIVIVKMHSWQNLNVVSRKNINIIFYEPSYNFSIYDIMTMADLMITDYSSIGLDFLLIDKPVIYSLYDEEKYLKTRGMCIEPIEEICGGEIAKTADELANNIIRSLLEGYTCPECKRVKDLFFKYQDGKTCERVYTYLHEKGIL